MLRATLERWGKKYRSQDKHNFCKERILVILSHVSGHLTKVSKNHSVSSNKFKLFTSFPPIPCLTCVFPASRSKKRSNPEVIGVLPQNTGLRHVRIGPDGARVCKSQMISAGGEDVQYPMSDTCWCFQASEYLLTCHSAERSPLHSMERHGARSPQQPDYRIPAGLPTACLQLLEEEESCILPLNQTAQTPHLVVQSVPHHS